VVEGEGLGGVGWMGVGLALRGWRRWRKGEGGNVPSRMSMVEGGVLERRG